MGSLLEDVLGKARLQAEDKGPLPGVSALIEQLETAATQRIFQPPAAPPEPRKLVLVAVGGQIKGEEFLNAIGIK